MTKPVGSAVTILFLIALCLPGASIADDAPQQSFRALIARGFRVAATTFIPSEAQTGNKPAILVTLQQDKSVAVCTIGVGAWEVMNKELLESSAQCDVRFY